MTKIPIAEAAPQLEDLVRKAEEGEEVILLKGNEPAVKLVPVEPTRGRPRRGFAKDVIVHIADDFDAPLEDFKDYT